VTLRVKHSADNPEPVREPTDLNFPRVLILSNQTPQTVYAGCILLYRLFEQYPADLLFVIGQAPHPDSTLLKCRYETIVPPLQRLHTTRLAALKRSLDAFGVLPGISPRRVRQILGDFKPDVVVSVMEERYAAVAARYAKSENIPLILIVHDKPELFDHVYPWATARQIKAHAAVYKSAAARLNVSPEMRDHLRELYGTAGDVMYPNRSEQIVPRPIEDSQTLRTPPLLTIGYAGTLAYGYGDQLRKLAAAIGGTNLRLKIYGAVARDTDPLATEFSDVVDCRGLISPPERLWPVVQAECDAVILPYAWSATGSSVDLYRTHFPSKLPEYLALGMPVIVMGPGFATGVAWGIRNPEAVIRLDVEDAVYWVDSLEKLRTDAGLRMNAARAAGVAGDRDVDPVRIRTEFVERIRSIAAGAGAKRT
jgi:glycosyltransferase involved in cell wall biosynthesis